MSPTTVLEEAIRDAHECDDEIQLYNEQIDTLWKEIEEVERSLERSSYDCQQLVVTQQTLRNKLDQYHRVIENEGNRWGRGGQSLWVQNHLLAPRFSMSGGVYLAWGAGGKDLTRAVQDITAVKPRRKDLPKNLPRKKEDRADEILEETPLRGPEDMKPGREVLKEEGESKLEPGDEEASPPTQEGAPEDVPDGGKISKAFEKLGKMIKEKVKGPREPEPPTDLYTKGRYVMVSGDASFIDPGFCVFSAPVRGGMVVSKGDDSVRPDGGLEPSPQQPEPSLEDGQGPPPEKEDNRHPPTLHPADKGDEKNAKKLEGLQGKQDGQKEEEGARGPCPMVAPGPEGPSTPRSQGPQVTLGGPEGHGAQSSSRPARSPPRKLAYEKVEVMESIEKFSTESIQTYEETAVIVETTIEKTKANKKKLGEKGSSSA
ncbi:filensin-like [Cervus elaphus]|uniref:filensin-like n=1 Tax=Cervus elaphus TaxID=9860 RepID=UPI001CC31C78|nr:filensin-like [Cervus elaphus]